MLFLFTEAKTHKADKRDYASIKILKLPGLVDLLWIIDNFNLEQSLIIKEKQRELIFDE